MRIVSLLTADQVFPGQSGKSRVCETKQTFDVARAPKGRRVFNGTTCASRFEERSIPRTVRQNQSVQNVPPEVIRQGEKSMASPASIKKHPVHPMLVALPIGLWIFTLVCDVVRAGGGATNWGTVATYCVAVGIVGALIAAVPGLIDYFSIDEAEMKRIATFHLAVNLGAVIVFAINLWLRFRLPAESNVPLGLSIVGIVAIGVGGWLGGEMANVKGMAVEAVEKLAKRLRNRHGVGLHDVA
jgi:uncharacterized membrane protein